MNLDIDRVIEADDGDALQDEGGKPIWEDDDEERLDEKEKMLKRLKKWEKENNKL